MMEENMMKRKMTKSIGIAMAAAMTMTGCMPALAEAATEVSTEAATPAVDRSDKTRVIISQDAEVDDNNSLVHTLLYANDLDIAGIVQSSSQFHYIGDEENEPLRWPGTDWMYEMLNAYEQVYPNLVAQDPDYPTADELRKVTVVGNIKMVGEMDEVTEGSELIKNAIMDDDPRKLYIAVGGGANTVGRALKSIEEEYKDTDDWDSVYQKVVNKVVLHAWGQQDNVYETYISVNWPDIPMYDVSGASGPYGYGNGSADIPEAAHKKMEGSWMYDNIEVGHGPLLDMYVTWGDGTWLKGEDAGSQFGTNEDMLGTRNWWGGAWMGNIYNRYDFLSEGDSPDWIVTIPTGLRNLEDESWGGWGGRYVRTTFEASPDALYYAQPKGETSMAPFVEAIQDDFAARADWCITPNYEDANHAPSVSVEEGLDLTAKAGDTITLHALAEDPDGDNVSFKWWNYAEAGTYQAPEDAGQDAAVQVTADKENPSVVTVTVPSDAKSGDTIHVILEGTDDGEHTLRGYQRVVVTVE